MGLTKADQNKVLAACDKAGVTRPDDFADLDQDDIDPKQLFARPICIATFFFYRLKTALYIIFFN